MSRTHILQPSPPRQASGLRRWREGKVRPIPGSSPHDRPVSRGISSSLKESLRRSLPRHRIPHQSRIILGAQYAFSKAWRNLSGPMGLNFKNQIQNQIPGRDQTASRWSAPSPGKRTRREEHALSHRPQMSSGRLFLDRVGRHQSPSPLHRRDQNKLIARSGGTIYHRTVSSVLTGCLTHRDKRSITLANQRHVKWITLTSIDPPWSRRGD